ncbi:MAG TPA: nucleotidyltransferase domain-containing protein [Planctomycetota bacterium]|nr:nucleotidyltransferase domain-containing protein [Planctomycetota bacterium]
MIFNRPLDALLGTRSKTALLRMMVRTRGEHTGRGLARLLGLDAKTCHTALQDLARQGVVEFRKAGPAFLYRLNDLHALLRNLLEPLFEREEALLADYARDLEKHVGGRILSLILFGSVARKEERPTSDVDLLLVVSTSAEARRIEGAIDRVTVDLARRYGSPPQVIVMVRSEFRRKARSGDRFLTEVLRSGRVVRGKPVAEVLRDVS